MRWAGQREGKAGDDLAAIVKREVENFIEAVFGRKERSTRAYERRGRHHTLGYLVHLDTFRADDLRRRLREGVRVEVNVATRPF